MFCGHSGGKQLGLVGFVVFVSFVGFVGQESEGLYKMSILNPKISFREKSKGFVGDGFWVQWRRMEL